MARGRDAAGPAQIPARGWWDIGIRVYARMSQTNLSLLAAGVAFYGLLSLFPGLAALTAIAGQFVSPEALLSASQTLSGVLPESAKEIVMTQLTALSRADDDVLSLTALLALALALYSASRAVQNIIAGLNVVYAEAETRGFILRTLLNLGLALCVVAGAVVAIALVAGLPLLISTAFPGYADSLFVDVARWGALFVLGAGGIAVLYRFGPSRRQAR